MMLIEKLQAPPTGPLAAAELESMDAWWRAANYLSVGQVYLLANPLLREPLTAAHVKPRLLGHFGTVPGLNFIYLHLNRVIKAQDLSVLFITGPGHGAPGVVASTWLEGTYSETYPDISQDEGGMGRLFRQFSFPGGIPSHAAADTPGSIHEGGELGYSLSHAYGAVLDNPGLIAACVIGDGEAETGPLAASWHSNKFINPAADGAVLPILHLNGLAAGPQRVEPPGPGLHGPCSQQEGRHRPHLPAAHANTLLWVTDHCLRSWDRINVVVAGKQPEPQWLGMDAAIKHCEAGLGIWDWASNDAGGEPDVVMACAGDVPTLECLAAVDLLRKQSPDLRVRVVNVVDLMTLQPKADHPHGLSDAEFDALFTTDKPVIFAFHGYPALIHRLIYNRANHARFHVHGFMDEGTTTTPFDMVVLNRLDRFHLMADAINRVPDLLGSAAYAQQAIRDKLVEHTRYTRAHGVDMPEVRDWRWPS